MRAGLAVALSLLLAPATASANGYVTCVQDQLARLAIEAGPADGIPGGQTRAGLAALAEKDPDLKPLPRLTRDNASVWCGEIGRRLDVRGPWPSARQQIRLIAHKEISPSGLRLLDITIRDARNFLVSALELDVPGTFVILVSTDIDWLAETTSRQMGSVVTRSRARKAIRSACKRTEGDSGVSFNGAIALCLGKSWQSAAPADETGIRRVRNLVAHEIIHEIQGQMIGIEHVNPQTRDQIKRGPEWLTEGIAAAIAFTFAYPELAREGAPGWFKYETTYTGEKLRKMSHYHARDIEGFGLYAGFAGALLLARYPDTAFSLYFRQTAVVGWRKAFEQAFGQSVDDFYDAFGT